MLAQPLRSPSLQLLKSYQAPQEARVAVLLNANARKVSSKVIASLSNVLPEEDLFISRSPMDARRIAQTVIERRYATVFSGGGDGTFMGFVTELIKQNRLRGHGRPLPRFGVLKLGTGNGIASLVNASSIRGDGILDDVLRARANEVPSTRRLDLLSVDGKWCQFAGLGVDGKVLNDYLWVKDTLGKGVLKRVMSGPSGYFASATCRSIPYYLTHSLFSECEVLNGAEPAYRLGPKGEVVKEFGPGELLHRGSLMMASASTIPYYGFEFTMFPFAGQRKGHMHLRLSALKTHTALLNLPKIWAGRFFNDGLLDFHAKDVTLHFKKPMPFQISGDAAGYRTEIRFSMAQEHVSLLDFA
jgi:diacylglycerol kinase family enzyme